MEEQLIDWLPGDLWVKLRPPLCSGLCVCGDVGCLRAPTSDLCCVSMRHCICAVNVLASVNS